MIKMLYRIINMFERYFEDVEMEKFRFAGEILSIVAMVGMIIVLLIAIFSM